MLVPVQSYDPCPPLGAAAHALLQIRYTNLPDMKLLSKGKVRDIYALPDEKDSDKLLFVATDRISAYDVIMENVRISKRTGDACADGS